MGSEQMSDLAKAVLAGERITPSTGVVQSSAAPMNGISVPKGATPITEGTDFISHGDSCTPAGSAHIRFSKNDEEQGKDK
ncbi:hypothetical protein [Intestinimonas butyriciproducens]|uniref:hypothetical protein n=1 Tax=Intestinimonas butyriciproducens TaxID=1297617 RepID=UPI0018AB67ED|nr:hypothetical protein [Intestinimonas butyriciproducens]MDB7816915.1 hypothetical protein [Intestinimonas butyriciproducens]MDB7842315.1 hypothetical protein [Intestinimonas butyriciproducens]MDB7857937.1 hypothetical protein [Intestinimonas butyriciproducens]MDE6840796.1 hypothetical protein [Oscillospiraceae bacterium]